MNIEKIFYIIISTILVTVFILLIFVFSLSNVDSQSSSKFKTLYYVDHISAAHQKVIDNFNERYKGSIKVETINLSFEKFSTNERKELLARYLRSKNEHIDIFSVDQIWVPRFARWAIPLRNVLDRSDIDDIIPNALQTCYYEDTLVAVPLYIDIAVMFYRDDLLKQLPGYKNIIADLDRSITWENFIALNNKINRLQKPFYVFQADDYEGLLCTFTELMANQNNPIIDNNDNILVNSPEGKKSLQLLIDLVRKFKISPEEVTNLKENESFRYFAAKNAYFLRGWSSMFDDRFEYFEKNKNAVLKMAPMPRLQNTPAKAVYGGWNLMISRFSDKIPEAAKFIKFLMSEESQKIMFEEGGYLPTNKNIYTETDYIKRNPDIRFFEDLFKNGVYRPFIKEYTSVSDVLSYYLNRAIKGEITADNALADAEKRIKKNAILIK